MTLYTVLAPLVVTIVDCDDPEAAKAEMLRRAGLEGRTWLTEGWVVRVSTEEDKRRYSAHVDALRPSQKTASTVANPRVPTAKRLGLFDDGPEAP